MSSFWRWKGWSAFLISCRFSMRFSVRTSHAFQTNPPAPEAEPGPSLRLDIRLLHELAQPLNVGLDLRAVLLRRVGVDIKAELPQPLRRLRRAQDFLDLVVH